MYLAMAAALAFVDFRMRAHQERPALQFIPAVVAGTADAPERYRVLIPFVVNALAGGDRERLPSVWLAVRLASFIATCLALHWYLATWFDAGRVLAGTAAVMALLPLTFTNSWAHPDHIPELALFSMAAGGLARERLGFFLLALAVAALNRETAAFLVVLCGIVTWRTRHWLAYSAAAGATWGVIYVGLRTWRGWVHYDYWQLGRNLEFLKLLPEGYDPYYRMYGWFFVAAFAPLLVLALRAGDSAPVFARRALLVVPLFVAVAFTFSSIVETRIFTPLFALTIPAAVAGLGRLTKEI